MTSGRPEACAALGGGEAQRHEAEVLAGMLVEDEYEPGWAFKDNRASCQVCGGESGSADLHVLPIESTGAVYYACAACVPSVKDAMRRVAAVRAPGDDENDKEGAA